eukprot:9486625-Pyramimonas_sp.AAC.1
MVDGKLAILLGHWQHFNIVGLEQAQTFDRVCRSHGHDIKKLTLTKRLCVSGVGHGAAVCDKSLRCKVACRERGDPAGQPAVPRLGTYSANVAEGSGGNLLAILGLRSMPNMGTILILEQGREKLIIPGFEMYKLPHGKGAR